ncbi:hypothetical protein SAMN05216474_0727 [Lishizhenia tianjinensis]|uniref:Carboxypeptidase regulatory-like domain-containing protein n=1 Tax=Lishizhenia tianjinensis TaxID=477690 RepID=A0A1I6Y8R1_9FLAO|nr:hypothetical protein [Lishizhenia tianjinensis]SFT46852.1 hypothetical protein SAMN05216474_0727 [Lishizhenia tianjinensis]
MKKTLVLALSLGLVFLTACKKEIEKESGIEDAGRVTGTITAPNNVTTIPNALLFIDYEGEIYYTYTDSKGYFELDAPDGKHTLHVQTGDGSIFRNQTEIEINEGKIVEINNADLRLTQAASIAYVPGNYDEIEAILTTLGYNATQISQQDLENINTLLNYDALFINCASSSANITPTACQNLNSYALNGNSIYVSDWAVAYLIGTNTGNCANARPGGFIQDNLLCTTKSGTTGLVNNCVINNTALSTYIGTSSVDIDFDLGSWEEIQNLDNTFWETLVSSPAGDPLMIRTQVFDTTHSDYPSGVSNNGNNGQWVTICHIPPGNPNNPITITINANALQTHLNHGDNIGPCSGSASGNILYTAFHNHPGGNNNPQMEDIMEWVILNM